MIMKRLSRYGLSLGLVALSLLSFSSVQATVFSGDATHAYSYHKNGQRACRSDGSTYTFYHDNGQVAWYGYTYQSAPYYGSLRKVYHANGEVAWRGASYQDEPHYGYERVIYHSNGRRAWGGATYQDDSSYHGPRLCYDDGSRLWHGATYQDERALSFERTVYHSNGTRAWGGTTYQDDSYYYCHNRKVYHSNGEEAWSGRPGSALYDEKGHVLEDHVDSVMVSLGKECWLYVSSKGQRDIYLSLGAGSFLIFSSNQEPRLVMHLGEDYDLNLFPHCGGKPIVTTGGQQYEFN